MHFLYNGNLDFEHTHDGKGFTNPYAKEAMPNIRPVEFIPDCAVAQEDVLVKSGYSTCSNGSCDDISLVRGEHILRVYKGDASSFSKYAIGTENEIRWIYRRMREITDLRADCKELEKRLERAVETIERHKYEYILIQFPDGSLSAEKVRGGKWSPENPDGWTYNAFESEGGKVVFETADPLKLASILLSDCGSFQRCWELFKNGQGGSELFRHAQKEAAEFLTARLRACGVDCYCHYHHSNIEVRVYGPGEE